MSRRTIPALLMLGVGIVLFAVFGLTSAQADDRVGERDESVAAQVAKRSSSHPRRRIRFEVAENATRFAFDEAPVANGMPVYGKPFITKGFLYPEGTLGDTDGDGAFDNGVIVEKDGNGNVLVRPEFPDKVIGLWICRGTVMAERGFEIETGPTVHTTQLYDFHELVGAFGEVSFTSTGLELIDLGVPIRRAIAGGTGPFERARGEVRQTLLGVNKSGGFNLLFEALVR